MKYFLIAANGRRKGMSIPVDVDLFLVGREEMCQLHADHPSLGGQHAAFIERDRRLFLNDMDSGFETRVNGEEMPPGSEWPLHAGDIVAIGALQFQIQFKEKALAQKDSEEWALKCLDHNGQRRVPVSDHHGQVDEHSKEYEGASDFARRILDHMNVAKGDDVGHIRIAKEGELTVVRINEAELLDSGELSIIRKELRDNLGRNHLKVLLDLKNVRSLSSSAAEMIGELDSFLKKHGSKLAVCRVRDELKKMLHAIASTSRIPIHRDHDAAKTAKW
jgi:anti-anti-sigma regulatory factor